MLQGNKIVVVMPAYNAARTLRQTYEEVIAHDIVDEIILVDDASRDETAAIARTLDRVRVEVHPQNRGYGGNQKTCYRLALGGGALRGGMPWWKYVSNRLLTLTENILLGAKLSEYHTGYRAFARNLLEKLPLEKNSDDFVFDNQMLAQIIWLGHPIGEITCPAKYMPEASSINFQRSVRYGLGCLKVGIEFVIARWRGEGSIFPRLTSSA